MQQNGETLYARYCRAGRRFEIIGGAVLATLGCILPGCCVVLVLSLLYRRYGSSRGLQTVLGTLRPATVALIAGAALSILAAALWLTEVFGGAGLAAFPWAKLVILAAAFAVLRSQSAWMPVLLSNPFWQL